MKKILLIVVAASFLLVSCSEYSCPTYARKSPAKEASAKRL